jgi:alkylation response protein AidB-like acyl-CoA dehydrogenase
MTEDFRSRARAFLAEHAAPRRAPAPDDVDGDGHGDGGGEAPVARDDEGVARAKAFQAALFDAGLAGITWPAEYGGQGLTSREQQIWNEEAAGYELPTGPFTIGHGMCGPTLLSMGTEEQKQRYIRPMLRGDEIWSQLFSEPGAGSDVASLQTRAVRDGDEWIVNGQKVWTSGAHYSDFGILIARTDPDQPKHRGISMFVLDMKAPGVTIRPLRQITGTSNFNEVFFDDVRIPHENLVGEVNEGWRGAITMLMNERVALGAGGGGGGRVPGWQALHKLARQRGIDSDPVVRQELVELYIRQRVLGYVGLRIREAVKAGRAPGPEGSIAKLSSSMLAWRRGQLAMQIAGATGTAWNAEDRQGNRWSNLILMAPASSIAGGTDQIQRNIIGERVLGLPKEPQVDRDIPFRDLKVGTQTS